MSRLTPDELNAIALEEARAASDLGEVREAQVRPWLDHYGNERLEVALEGERNNDVDAFSRAVTRASIAIRDRLMSLGEDRYPILRFETLGYR